MTYKTNGWPIKDLPFLSDWNITYWDSQAPNSLFTTGDIEEMSGEEARRGEITTCVPPFFLA